ncbi:hypothetical protein ACXET9_08850 [Brachybacterium sp. DNPG3]
MTSRRALLALGTSSAVVLLGAGCGGQPSADGASGETPEETAAESVVEVSADYPDYGSLEAAFEAADTVVVGTVECSREAFEHPDAEVAEGADDSGTDLENPQSGVDLSDEDCEAMGVLTSIATLRVTEVISGDVEVGDSLDVVQTVGADDRATSEDESGAPIEEVDSPEVLLLLSDLGDGAYVLVNPFEGVYTVADGRLGAVTADGAGPDVGSLEELRELAG